MLNTLNMFLPQETKILIHSILDTRQEWKLGNYTFSNKQSKTKIWIASGLFFIDFYPKVQCFNLLEKYLILKAIKRRIILDTVTYENLFEAKITTRQKHNLKKIS